MRINIYGKTYMSINELADAVKTKPEVLTRAMRDGKKKNIERKDALVNFINSTGLCRRLGILPENRRECKPITVFNFTFAKRSELAAYIGVVPSTLTHGIEKYKNSGLSDTEAAEQYLVSKGYTEIGISPDPVDEMMWTESDAEEERKELAEEAEARTAMENENFDDLKSVIADEDGKRSFADASYIRFPYNPETRMFFEDYGLEAPNGTQYPEGVKSLSLACFMLGRQDRMAVSTNTARNRVFRGVPWPVALTIQPKKRCEPVGINLLDVKYGLNGYTRMYSDGAHEFETIREMCQYHGRTVTQFRAGIDAGLSVFEALHTWLDYPSRHNPMKDPETGVVYRSVYAFAKAHKTTARTLLKYMIAEQMDVFEACEKIAAVKKLRKLTDEERRLLGYDEEQKLFIDPQGRKFLTMTSMLEFHYLTKQVIINRLEKGMPRKDAFHGKYDRDE